MLRSTSITSASRVNSSTMFSSFSARPSAISSNWKSNAHTWFRPPGAQPPSRNGRLAKPPALALALRAPRSPSSRRGRLTRLRFHLPAQLAAQPVMSPHRMPPHRGRSTENTRSSARNTASSSAGLGS